MHHPVPFLLLAVALCNVQACKPDPRPTPKYRSSVDLSGWDLSCTSNADCVAVEANRCNKCGGCPTHAIAKRDQSRFNREADQTRCPPPDPDEADIVCGACSPARAACQAGQCKAIH